MNEKEISEALKKQEEILILTQKLWRAEKWRRFWGILRYLIFVFAILGGFYFIRPYLGTLAVIFENLQKIQRNVQFLNQEELQKYLEQLKQLK